MTTVKYFIDELIDYNKTPSTLYGDSLTPVITKLQRLSDDNYE
jgi:hypothetical protein